MTRTQKLRWKKFLAHMDQPQRKLAHKKFCFRVFNSNLGLDPAERECGTLGCAAGELPAVFPKVWAWGMVGHLSYKGVLQYSHCWKGVCDFLGISVEEAEHCFAPNRQSQDIDPYYKTHYRLKDSATRIQVVNSLKRFLKIKGVI